MIIVLPEALAADEGTEKSKKRTQKRSQAEFCRMIK
jgi:hypothetical protein